jgi:hypothetical protein
VTGPTGRTGAAGPQGPIGPTGAQGPVGQVGTVGSSTPSTSTTVAAIPAEGLNVQDGMPQVEADYQAAIKKCESVNFNRTQCINTAKETYGRI